MRTWGVLLGCVLLILTTGCTGGTDGQSAGDAADDLAQALGTGDLTGLEFSGGTPQQAQRLYRRTVTGLDDSRARVDVDDVTEGGDGKPTTVRLSYVWRLAGSEEPWTYTTEATVDRGADDAWRVALDPALVHPDLRPGERLELTSTPANRADILGAGGARLVTERTVFRLGVDKTEVRGPAQVDAARELARATDIDVADYVARVRAAGDKAFVEAIVLRPRDAQPVLDSGIGDVKGIGVVRDSIPLAPTRDFARAVLGSVGPVTAEMVKESDGVYEAGDEAGLSGLEERYDDRLRGTPGAVVDAVAADGATRQLFEVDPKPGEPLRTTVDPTLQRAAERSLSGVGPASAVVAIRPSTGDLLAVASGPGSKGYSTATVGQYAPGSTFKVVSSLALLRAGATPSTRLSCPATTVVNGKTFKNYDDYPADGLGRIPLRTAVANSCNTAFIEQRDRVSQAALAGAAAALGLGVDHDIGFPAYFGAVPATEDAAGSETGHAASLIGQGRVTASPLAMAAVAASVARGKAVVPRLLTGTDGATEGPSTDPADVATPVTSAEAATLRTLMRGVVTGGSGHFLADLPGAPVLAKTGTAEFGTEEPLATHAWMIAVQGDLAVAVFVDVGDSGSGTAGPVLERFLRAAR